MKKHPTHFSTVRLNGNFLARNTRGSFCGFLSHSRIYWAPQTANRLPNRRDESCAIRLPSPPARGEELRDDWAIPVFIVPPTVSVVERDLCASQTSHNAA